MNVLTTVGGILLIIASILLVILVLMQESKQPGMNALSGQTDSYLSKNKGRTLEARIVFLTKILVTVFFVFTIATNLIIKFLK